ncbi:hypothetical protein BSAF29S_05436 [Bacillus safensis subsp. safensis]
MQTENRKLTLKNYIGYGTMDIFGGGAFAIIGAWMLYFFIKHRGLTPLLKQDLLLQLHVLLTR